WQDILGTTIEKGYYFQFHWMDSPEERARKAEEIETFNFIGWILVVEVRSLNPRLLTSFNFIGWILHHHAPCSLWKFLSSPLYGFYSIEPPVGGSMYVV
ncbi:MAG: hypothetical protein LM584_06830, partial [Desulfurococcaceae archaeon]|nr:hypothetical protein [Desulfurococcaceae archaeon]